MGEAPRGGRSGWVSAGSCSSRASRTGARWRRRSRDLARGSEAGGLDPELMGPLGAGREGSGSAELRGGDVAEGPGRSGGSSGTGHQGDDPALRAAGWSSLLPRAL